MGTWGTRLTDDDYAADVIAEYFELYNSGKEPGEVRSVLEKNEVSSISDPNDGYMFWLALAKAQWDVGALDQDVFRKVRQIVESDVDTKNWIARGARETDAQKRKISISNFLLKLEKVNPKPKKRKKTRLKSSPFNKGDVLVFKFSDGYYGATVVFNAEKESRFGETGLVALHLHQASKPTIQEVENAEVLVSTQQDLRGRVDWTVAMHLSLGFKNVKDRFEKIGNLEVKKVTNEINSGGRWEIFIRFTEAGIGRLGKSKITAKDFLEIY